MLELLPPCSGVSEQLTRERGVHDGFLTTGPSLSLAETLTTGSLVAPAPLDGAPGLSVPAEEFLVENLLEGNPNFF